MFNEDLMARDCDVLHVFNLVFEEVSNRTEGPQR